MLSPNDVVMSLAKPVKGAAELSTPLWCHYAQGLLHFAIAARCTFHGIAPSFRLFVRLTGLPEDGKVILEMSSRMLIRDVYRFTVPTLCLSLAEIQWSGDGAFLATWNISLLSWSQDRIVLLDHKDAAIGSNVMKITYDVSQINFLTNLRNNDLWFVV